MKSSQLKNNYCFIYRHVLQNRVNIGHFLNRVFCQKAQHFVHFLPYDLLHISSTCSPNTYQFMYGDLQDQYLQWQIYCNIGFSERSFYVAITDSDIASLKSLRTYFDNYLDHIVAKFEQNRLVGNMQSCELAKYD